MREISTSNILATYSEARKKISDSERTSDLSEIECQPTKRTRKRPAAFVHDSSDEDDESPHQTKLTKPPTPPHQLPTINWTASSSQPSDELIQYDQENQDGGITITLPEAVVHDVESQSFTFTLPETPVRASGSRRISDSSIFTQRGELQNFY